MDLIGYSKPFFSFGQSALRSDAPAYSATARDHVYLLFGEERELFFDGDRTLLAKRSCFPRRTRSATMPNGSRAICSCTSKRSCNSSPRAWWNAD